MLLTPSRGFGGGIERVVDHIEYAWNGPVVRVGLYQAGRHRLRERSSVPKLAFTIRAITTAIRVRPTIVLTVHVGLLPVAMSAAMTIGARTALFVHGAEVWGPMSPGRTAMVRACSRILSVSAFSAEVLSARSGLPRSRIVVTPAPVPPNLLLAAAALDGPAGGRPAQLLTVSKLDAPYRYKGHFEVAQAWPKVLARCPDARWVVVGDGDDTPALRAECDRLGVSHTVRFVGRPDDRELARLYASSRGFVLPSVADIDATPPIGEGLGLVYAEAAAFAVPSIASAVGGGAGEVVVDGCTGLTVPPGDCVALAEAMIRLLVDEPLRERLGYEARRRVLARHTSERFANTLHRALLAGDNSVSSTP